MEMKIRAVKRVKAGSWRVKKGLEKKQLKVRITRQRRTERPGKPPRRKHQECKQYNKQNSHLRLSMRME